MRKFKIFMASVLAYFMLISLAPSNLVGIIAKAEENNYKILKKENSYVAGSYAYNNEMIVAYRENNELTKLVSIKNGEETVIDILGDYYGAYFNESTLDNVVLISLSLEEWGSKEVYKKLDLVNKKVSDITEEEYNSLIKIENSEEENIKKEYSDAEKEEVLQKLNKEYGLNLTISDKTLEPVDEYYSQYVNEDQSIYIYLESVEGNSNIISFYITTEDNKLNNNEKYVGVIYNEYIYMANTDEYSRYLPRYRFENGILTIVSDLDYDKVEIIRVDNKGLLSYRTAKERLAFNNEFEVSEDYFYVRYTPREGQYPNISIYKATENTYEKVDNFRSLNIYGFGENKDLYTRLTEDKLELIRLVGSNIEVVYDLTNTLNPNEIGYYAFSQGEEDNFLVTTDIGKFAVFQKESNETPVVPEEPSNPNEDEVVTPPTGDNNKPSEDIVLDIEVPTLKPNEINEIPVVAPNNSFNLILKDIETLKNGQGSLKAVLNNVTLNLPFSVLDKTLLSENDTVSVKLDVVANSEITKDLKAVNKVFDFNLVVNKENEEVKIHNFKEGVAEITVVLSNEELQGLNKDKLKVYYYNEETKKFEAMETKVDGNNVTFKTSHFSKYVIAEEIVDNDDEVTIKPDTNKPSTDGTTNNEQNKTETGKLPATGSIVSNNTILVLALGIVLVGGVALIRKKNVA